MTYNAGERSDIRKAEKAQKAFDRQSADIIRNLMSTSPGRAWVLSLLESAHVFASSFDRDAVAMAFQEGERNQGLQLLNSIMRHCPDQYIIMMRESNERHLASERSRQSDRDGGDQGPDSEDGGPGGDEARDDDNPSARH